MTDKIRIGKISGAAGVKGEIKLFHDSGERERIAGIRELYFLPPGGVFLRGTVISMRYKGKTPILRVADVDTRAAAERLVGADVYADRASLAPLGEGSYYVEAITGFDVVNEEGERIGAVAGILDNPAHDILRIASGDGELLLPMIDQFVIAVELDARRITVRPPEGFADGAVRYAK